MGQRCLLPRETDRQTEQQKVDLVSLQLFYQKKESRLKLDLCQTVIWSHVWKDSVRTKINIKLRNFLKQAVHGTWAVGKLMAPMCTSWALNVVASFAKAKTMCASHRAHIDWASKYEIHSPVRASSNVHVPLLP
jgi:hypothetical protein